MSDCSDLIGLPYRLGADGSDGHIDCIHLCYVALERMGIDAPAFKQSWYEASKWEVCRDLMRWGFGLKSLRMMETFCCYRSNHRHLQSHGRRESCTSIECRRRFSGLRPVCLRRTTASVRERVNQTIGLSEESIESLRQKLGVEGMVRPAAYDHIPDIQAGAATVPILVNLRSVLF